MFELIDVLPSDGNGATHLPVGQPQRQIFVVAFVTIATLVLVWDEIALAYGGPHAIDKLDVDVDTRHLSYSFGLFVVPHIDLRVPFLGCADEETRLNESTSQRRVTLVVREAEILDQHATNRKPPCLVGVVINGLTLRENNEPILDRSVGPQGGRRGYARTPRGCSR